MAASLKIIATPLGNIRDISLRAIDAIKQADLILAEDTRHSLKLIEALNISLKPQCRLISCDSHKEKQRIAVVLERLQANDSVVLLSDAGCPTISDPGSLLIEGIIAAGFKPEIFPGPSAHTAALMGAGLDTTRFAFLGFLPQKISLRKKLIIAASEANLALVIYEAPHRIQELLDLLFELLGSHRVVIARELTKIYETFHRGRLGETLDPPLVEKGECVIVVEAGAKPRSQPVVEQDEAIKQYILKVFDQNKSTKEIARLVALEFKIKKTTAYDWVQKFKP